MMVPSRRPMQPREKTAKLLLERGVHDAVALLGVRGYYLDSMGKPGVNDIGSYDDALFLTSPSCHLAFNANVDPSISRDGIATLQPGLWRFSMSIHGKSRPPALQYPCLEQCQPVTVRRYYGTVSKLDTGMFAIQVHRGGYNVTSSEGCQTVYPDQYDSFIHTVADQLKRFGQATIPYLLLEFQG